MKLVEQWQSAVQWLNVDIGREVRRIDVVILSLGFFCISYYAYFDGLRGALLGGLFYVMVVMVSVWLI
jgi:hypothetical protein